MRIKEIKERLTMEEVLQHYNIKTRYNNLHCPFHEDKTPSMKLYKESNTVYCFSGNCDQGNKSMDQIDFIMHMEKTDKKGAVQKASELLGETKRPKQAPSPTIRVNTLTSVFEECQTNLTKSKKAKNYCRTRNLINTHEIGYFTDRQIQSWTSNQKQAAISIELIQEQANKRFTTTFKNCLIFPMRNKKGEIVSLYGRQLEGKQHYYMKGPHQGLYPNYPNKNTKHLLITESIIDAASLYQYKEVLPDDSSILALYGTNGMTPEIKEAIKDLKELKEVTFLLDGDEAGNKGTTRNAATLHHQTPKIKITQGELPEGEDINSLLVGHEIGIIDAILKARKTLHKPTETAAPQEEKKAQKALDTTNPDKLVYSTELLEITIWGGVDFGDLSKLKLSLNITPTTHKHSFRDEVNLYSNRSKKHFISDAAEELDLAEGELKSILDAFTKEVEAYRLEQKESYKNRHHQEIPLLSPTEKQQAITELQNKELVKGLKVAMRQVGLIGEVDNGLLLFLIFLTRDFPHPLHALVHGSSGSGKTNLLKSILKLVPEESKYETTALTENVLFRPPYQDFWKNKILLLEDLDGSYKALLPLREFMSNQSISKFASELNPRSGKYEQIKLEAEGPIVIAGATTKDKVYEDNSNRSFLIHVNESKHHQVQIMDYQNQQAAGLIDLEESEEICQLIQNMQRMLNPEIKVINPFQPSLKLPEYIFKKLRTNTHYITLIQSITYLHQYQRTIKTNKKGQPYIETTLEDVQLANELSKQSLLRKSDELSGEERSFFELLKKAVKESGKATFQSKDIREEYRMHPMKLKRRLDNLQARNYIKKVGGKQKGSYEYEIVTWDDYQVLQNGLQLLDDILNELWHKYPDGVFRKTA